MNLSEGEEKVSELYFKNQQNKGYMSTLTSKRLVVTYKNAEESYPLSKITAVKWMYQRSMLTVIAGGFAVVAGATGLFHNAPVIGLIFLGVGLGLAYYGWLGKTVLQISQMGGEKQYAIQGRSPALMSFVDAVNHRLA